MDPAEVRMGMTVQLNSGGPRMTIVGEPTGDPPEAYCMWFLTSGEERTTYIPCFALSEAN